jgi:hypothetical protein
VARSSGQGPAWDQDEPADLPRLGANAIALLTRLLDEAQAREAPTQQTGVGWHTALFAGCTVPRPGYIGRYRGDPAEPGLMGYEIGIGAGAPDGLTEKVGVWSGDVAAAVESFVAGARAAVTLLDGTLPAGRRPTSTDEVDSVVTLAAVLHGDWVRIHPFANGNGRTARTWANWAALRYGLPAFVSIVPRPSRTLYARAAAASMGRPPDFTGDHAMTTALFAHWLTDALDRG